VSALGVQDDLAAKNGTWKTRDPVLATTLGTLGFLCRGKMSHAIIYDGRKIVKAAEKHEGGVNLETGAMDDLAEVEIVFEYETVNPHFGRITCSQVLAAHDLAKLRFQDQITHGNLDGSQRLKMEDLAARCKAQGINDFFMFHVQGLHDQLHNWNVQCNIIAELNRNPFLKFSRALKRNGVASTLNPLEVESTANRRSEKLFRGETP
jgi:hypothetical protein